MTRQEECQLIFQDRESNQGQLPWGLVHTFHHWSTWFPTMTYFIREPFTVCDLPTKFSRIKKHRVPGKQKRVIRDRDFSQAETGCIAAPRQHTWPKLRRTEAKHLLTGASVLSFAQTTWMESAGVAVSRCSSMVIINKQTEKETARGRLLAGRSSVA